MNERGGEISSPSKRWDSGLIKRMCGATDIRVVKKDLAREGRGIGEVTRV